MGKKELSPEEVTTLCSSPHVACVISDRVNFTTEFKKIMYEELINGKTIRTTLREHGIDPEILGDRRIWGIAEKLRINADRNGGFQDLRSGNFRKPAKGTGEQDLAARIGQLEHELAYARQEIEFLKKVHKADLEARKRWESKLRLK